MQAPSVKHSHMQVAPSSPMLGTLRLLLPNVQSLATYQHLHLHFRRMAHCIWCPCHHLPQHNRCLPAFLCCLPSTSLMLEPGHHSMRMACSFLWHTPTVS